MFAYQNNFFYKILLATVLGIFFVAGCTQKMTANPDAHYEKIKYIYLSEDIGWPDTRLEKKFSRYWNKRFTGKDPEGIYSYEAPHFQKMVLFPRYEAYLNNLPKGEILRIEIAEFIRATEYLYEVPLTIIFQGRDGREHSMGTRDRWVFVEGVWYHVLRDPLAFPGIG